MTSKGDPVVCPACEHEIGRVTGWSFEERLEQMSAAMDAHIGSCLPSMRVVKQLRSGQ